MLVYADSKLGHEGGTEVPKSSKLWTERSSEKERGRGI
jgi:hypothetical protein